MRHLPIIVLLGILAGWTINLFAQNNPDDRRWSRPMIDHMASGTPQNTNWQPAPQVHRKYIFDNVLTDVGPNFRPHPTTNSTQSEMSVDIHPFDDNIIFGSANASSWPGITIYGTGVYWSVDGSVNWSGFDSPPFGTNGGDPASAIGPNGYFYEAYLAGGSYTCGIAVSTNYGSTWTTHTAYGVSDQDKEHVMVDKDLNSPYANRVYYTWSDLNAGEAALVYSTDFGTTWSSYKNLSGTITPLGSAFAQGPNVQTGPNGEVYVCFAIYDANWTDGEDAIGFAKSTDGGNTWTQMRAFEHVNFGIRGTLSSKSGIRVNSFPSMAVDRSGGPHNGNIYITWPQRGFAPAGSDPDVVVLTSQDGGATWTGPVRVNDDALNNGKDQIFPWCTVDQSTGRLLVVFYDSRNVANNQAEVYMASSFDGAAFDNFVVSDQSFVFGPINGFAGGYGGDYIGVAANNGIAYPFWMDSRTGNSQGWMAQVTFEPPCGIEAASNPNPASGSTNVDINIAQLSWTNGAGANTNELYFGTNPGALDLVQSGSLATSWNIDPSYLPLDYYATYYWKVVEIGDTCNQSATFNFKTMQDPNFVEVTDTLYPQSAQYWTGSTQGTTKTDGEINTLYPTVGWAVFDISSIPAEATVTGVSFYGYINAVSYPYWSATPMGTVNPVTDNAATINSQIQANYGSSAAYIYSTDQLVTGWYNSDLQNNAVTDLQNAIPQGFFAIGFIDWDFSTSWYINFDGWSQTNPPYIIVDYNYITPVELTSFVATANNGNVILNWATATETNNKGFEIERKTEKGEYQRIGYIAGFGTTTQPKNYSYTDNKLDAGKYVYRLKQIDLNGASAYLKEAEVEVTTPATFSLEQNYPNPFNPTTMIQYSIPADQQISLNIYNLLGEKVMTLVNGFQKAGQHEVNFNASSLASGIYFYKLEAGANVLARKMILMK